MTIATTTEKPSAVPSLLHTNIRNSNLPQHTRHIRRAFRKPVDQSAKLRRRRARLERPDALPDGAVDDDVGAADGAVQLCGDEARLLLDDAGGLLPDGDGLVDSAGRHDEDIEQDDGAGVVGIELCGVGSGRVGVESGEGHGVSVC